MHKHVTALMTSRIKISLLTRKRRHCSKNGNWSRTPGPRSIARTFHQLATRPFRRSRSGRLGHNFSRHNSARACPRDRNSNASRNSCGHSSAHAHLPPRAPRGLSSKARLPGRTQLPRTWRGPGCCGRSEFCCRTFGRNSTWRALLWPHGIAPCRDSRSKL